MNEILKLLERDSRLTAHEIAEITERPEAEVAAEIAKLERERAIVKYSALIDWNKSPEGGVNALIEVKISPQRGDGYERIAERIYQYDEVDSLYLMSGAFDLAVMMTAPSMRHVSEFVFAHLAAIDGVTATATHFIMKKYKEKGCIFDERPEQEERGLFV
ncbi:MAG: Lrp/AsnC family transcriptional regulator [Oscillospiraceae bacterium]|jgi:DNA-binding Lrp family transcriptional regulator|nr:Lrp/AsnC family transcriptional regulator [Oscillospiraceae bacterium]